MIHTIKRFKSLHVDRFLYRSPNGFIEAVGVLPISKKKLPLILFYRGGTGDFAAIENRTIANFFMPLAEAGFAVFGSQYSGGPNSEGKDEYGGKDSADMPALLASLRNGDWNLDFDRIGALAVSRGAMMVLQNLKDGLPIRRLASVSGAYDFRNLKKERPDMYLMLKKKKMFNPDSEDELARRSALSFAPHLPNIPYLLMHSNPDSRTSFKDAKEMKKKLKKGKLITFKGDDHALIEHTDERNAILKNWFSKL
ncbi:MAG: prolyl oligopeptidase family serine peptidase [Patescibacteria group bacterium]|jgi:dipeptidyl aminopeptidase/acylaminoacyl peptidase